MFRSLMQVESMLGFAHDLTILVWARKSPHVRMLLFEMRLHVQIVEEHLIASSCWTFVIFDIWVTGPHMTVPMARGREDLVAFFNWAGPCFVGMDDLEVLELRRTAEEESLAAFILEAAMYDALRVRIQRVRVPVLVGPKQFRTQRAGACYTAMFRVRPPNVRVHLVYCVICQLAIGHGAEPRSV